MILRTIVHGTREGYRSGCRDECCMAWRRDTTGHGKRVTYTSYWCSCPPCKKSIVLKRNLTEEEMNQYR